MLSSSMASHAEMYGRRAKRARTVEEVGDNVKRVLKKAAHGSGKAVEFRPYQIVPAPDELAN